MGQLRHWIQGVVAASALLLSLLVFAVGIWGVLITLGDETGAEVARGVAAVIAGSFVMTHILLVTLLALAVLQRNMEQETPADRAPHF